MVQAYDETKDIAEISLSSDGGLLSAYYGVGKSGITRIQAYREAGEMGYVLWFAILDSDGVLFRVNGKYVPEVRYA